MRFYIRRFFSSLLARAATQNEASIVMDARHDNTRRENQSSTTAR